MLKTKPIIYDIYNDEIYPEIEPLEGVRRSLLNLVLIRGGLIPFLGVGIGVLYYHDKSNIIISVILGAVLSLLLLYINFSFPPEQKLFREKLKEKCFHIAIKKFADINLWQKNKNPSEIIPDTELHKSGLFEIFTHRKNDDEFRGKYNNLEFSVSESELIFDNGFSKPNTIFKGLILKFKSNKKIEQRTIIASKKQLQLLGPAILAFFLCMLQATIKTENLLIGTITGVIGVIGVIIIALTFRLKLTKKEKNSNINLEDIFFSKEYKVFSEDEVEARYLLSPTFIEKFTKLEKFMKAASVKCSFYDDSIMIAILSDKDFFEFGSLYKNIQEIETIEKFYEDISIIFELIEYFKLDTKIGL